MTSNKKIEIVFVVPYFGRWPSYFPLWLDSCRRNPSFTWVLITDCSLEGLDVPSNVTVRLSDLQSVKSIFKESLAADISLEHAYKLCDYKPLYWLLLDAYGIQYDFWGHCDLDVVFGRLDLFVTPELLCRNDRLFALGHLSLMRNCPLAKIAFSLKSSAPSWRDVLSRRENFGFDEHSGVNRAWLEYPMSFHLNDNVVADIDPQFRSFRLTNLRLNKRGQIFYLEDGKILQGYFDSHNEWITREYAYIHFQKRSMPIGEGATNAPTLLIGPTGFFALNRLPANRSELQSIHNDIHSDLFREWGSRFRTWVRYYRRSVRHALGK